MPGTQEHMTTTGPWRPPGAGVEHSQRPSAPLPGWPLVAILALFPLWWVLGLVDVMWIPVAGVMTLYMVRARVLRVPRGFGIWLIFLVTATFSAIQLDASSQLLGLTYRMLIYLACTVFFLYVYNGGEAVKSRFVAGTLTMYWVVTVVGGYLGLLFPTAVIRTPMSFVMPEGLLANDLVNHMVVRRFAQYNPGSFFDIDPRPSAPFLYTNNWGNAFSLLLPIVIAYLVTVRGKRRFWWLVAALPVSLVPAFMTLNRGMFIGLGIALAYACGRFLLMRRGKAVAVLGGLALVGGLAFLALPVQERLENRLEQSSTTETRSSLYDQAVAATAESPFFGHGAPQEAANPNAPPVGTQGQFWLVLVSHGPLAAMCFTGWFLYAWWRSRRRRDPVGFACNAVLIVGTIELFYYGVLPNGLPILMLAAALALRSPDEGEVPGVRSMRHRTLLDREPIPGTVRGTKGAIDG